MKTSRIRNTIIALSMAAIVGAGGLAGYFAQVETVPELIDYVDAFDGYEIAEEEVPLGVTPVVTTKTTTKTSTKKTTMSTKAKKTKSTTTKKTTKSSKTDKEPTETIKTDTTKLTTTVTSVKKNSKTKTIKTTVKTTVKTTTTPVASKQTLSINAIAPKAHSNVLSAFNQLGFTCIYDPSVSYSGQLNASARTLTIQKNSDEAIYHELGHFVAFVSGNSDQTAEFASIYNAEKSLLVATRNNQDYVTSTAAEYFAESYQDYVENPSALQASRPLTYDYIVAQVAKVTSTRCSLLLQVYGSYWNA